MKTIMTDAQAFARRQNLEVYVTTLSRFSGIAAFVLSLAAVGYILIEAL